MMDLIKVLEISYEEYTVKKDNVKKKSKVSIFDALKSLGNQLFQSS